MELKEKFTKLHHNLYIIEDLNLSEIIILNLLISFHFNNKKIYISNKGIVKHFNNKLSESLIQKVIPKLEKLEYITIKRNYSLHERTIKISKKTLLILKGETTQHEEKPKIKKESKKLKVEKSIQPKPEINYNYQIEKLIEDSEAEIPELILESIKKIGDIAPYIKDGKLQIKIKLGQFYLVKQNGEISQKTIPKHSKGFDSKIFNFTNSDKYYIKENVYV